MRTTCLRLRALFQSSSRPHIPRRGSISRSLSRLANFLLEIPGATTALQNRLHHPTTSEGNKKKYLTKRRKLPGALENFSDNTVVQSSSPEGLRFSPPPTGHPHQQRGNAFASGKSETLRQKATTTGWCAKKNRKNNSTNKAAELGKSTNQGCSTSVATSSTHNFSRTVR